MAFKAKTGENKHHSHTVKAAISEATKDNMVGLNISISKRKRLEFKTKAAMKDETMQDVILRAINSYIER